MRALVFPFALCALVAGACVRPPDTAAPSEPASVPGVAFAAERSGEVARLALTNRSNGPVGYNLCTSALLRRTGSGWTVVPTDLVCTMELRILPPGETAGFPYPLPPGLTKGEYAWRARVEIDGAQREVVSNPLLLP